MSAAALRRVMGHMSVGLDQDLANAFYEVLSQTPLLVPEAAGAPVVMRGPGGQPALPVFLDRPALLRWSKRPMPARTCSAREAAAIALGTPGAWLVVDFESSPGGQPVARAGVELLAAGSYPHADRYREQEALVAELLAVGSQDALSQELLARAARTRFFTIGDAHDGPEISPGVYESPGMSLQTVRGPDGALYLPAWPSLGATFVFMPEAPRRLHLELGRLVRGALAGSAGLVIGAPAPTLSWTPVRLASAWR